MSCARGAFSGLIRQRRNIPKPGVAGFTAHSGKRDDSSGNPERVALHDGGQSMPQSLVQFYVHLIFSTKHRQPWLTDRQQREQLHAYMTGICRNQDAPSIIIGGVEDHVHLLIRMGKSHVIPDLVRDLKRDSTKWIKEQFQNLADFHWQEGYAAFSVSPGHVDAIRGYIATQEEHHQRESFQDELRRVLKKCGMDWDERYVWD